MQHTTPASIGPVGAAILFAGLFLYIMFVALMWAWWTRVMWRSRFRVLRLYFLTFRVNHVYKLLIKMADKWIELEMGLSPMEHQMFQDLNPPSPPIRTCRERQDMNPLPEDRK